MYNSKYSFSEYRNVEIYVDDQSQNLKNHNRLNDLKKFTDQAENTRAKKKIVYNNAKNVFNKLLSIC